jgi:TPR repeat protein
MNIRASELRSVCMTLLLSFGLLCVSANAQQVTVSELKKKAEAGDPRAQGLLGLVYCRGEMGEAVNYATALKYLSPAAKEGDAFGL